jgi:hypothetical protein
MYSTVEDLLKFDNAISLTSYFRKHNRIDDLPKKTLDNVAFGFWYADGYGIFNSKFVYRPGGILGSTSNWIHMLDNKKSIIIQQYRCNQSL